MKKLQTHTWVSLSAASQQIWVPGKLSRARWRVLLPRPFLMTPLAAEALVASRCCGARGCSPTRWKNSGQSGSQKKKMWTESRSCCFKKLCTQNSSRAGNIRVAPWNDSISDQTFGLRAPPGGESCCENTLKILFVPPIISTQNEIPPKTTFAPTWSSSRGSIISVVGKVQYVKHTASHPPLLHPQSWNDLIRFISRWPTWRFSHWAGQLVYTHPSGRTLVLQRCWTGNNKITLQYHELTYLRDVSH